MKNVHGVTLIALVVTIILLSLLTGVTISLTSKDGGLIEQTKNTVNVAGRKQVVEWAKAEVMSIEFINKGKVTKEEFKEVLDKYFIYELEGGDFPDDLSSLVLTTKDKKYNDILASEIFNDDFYESSTALKKISEIKKSKKLVSYNTNVISDDNIKITLPAGFTISDESPSNAKEGIIITDSIDESTGKSNGNEFVWIPVDSDLKVVGTQKPMAKVSTAEGFAGANGKTNYEGVLYDFVGTTSSQMSSYGQGVRNK